MEPAGFSNALFFVDGRKSFPINHGATSAENFLQVLQHHYNVTMLINFGDVFSFQDAAKVCQNFMSRDPSELHFTIVALSAAP